MFYRLLSLCFCLFLGGCFKKDDNTIKVGVTAGPHAIIMEKVQDLAKKENIKLKIVEFNDFILPNMALDQGDLDLNSYQHDPFLQDQIKSRGYKIIDFGKTVLMPMGIYSKSIKDIESSKNQKGIKIAIPNDPTNGGRALLLLEQTGFIKIKSNTPLPTLHDITENSLNINFIEIEAPQLPRSLEDVDLAVINTDWVLLSGMDITSSLALESKESPYANVLAIREEDKNKESLLRLRKIYQSKEIADFIQQHFKGAVLKAW